MVEVEVDQRKKGRGEVEKHSVAENIIASLSRHRDRGRLRWQAESEGAGLRAGAPSLGRLVGR